MNYKEEYDCIITGGGLAGTLLFYALKSLNPGATVLLVERNSVLAGNHTWCFHESDISWCKENWVRDLITKSWSNYEVIFPKYKRTINTPYHCIQSHKLHESLISKFSDDIVLNANVDSVSKDNIIFSNGQKIKAKCVVDARGWTSSNAKIAGYQKFMGLDLKLKKPVGLSGVRLKDVSVEQIDGYRFVYVLPWVSDELLVEDTYYSNSKELDLNEIRERILSYVKREGWEVESILREESGCLPLVCSSELSDSSPVAALGARSGNYQPVTGYTFPQTFRSVVELSSLCVFDTDLWKKKLQECRQEDRGQRRYFHFLNKMLFFAASPENRYVVLERFYRFPVELIERFYRGKLTLLDQVRILFGKPPVPIIKAIKSILKR